MIDTEDKDRVRILTLTRPPSNNLDLDTLKAFWNGNPWTTT